MKGFASRDKKFRFVVGKEGLEGRRPKLWGRGMISGNVTLDTQE